MKQVKLIVIMGVSGSGKTTVAKQLAADIDGEFLDADDFHSDSARQQMAQGKPLTDEQRAPWLARMIAYLNSNSLNNKVYVLAYSGLKRGHRQLFRELRFPAKMVMLSVSKELVELRIKQRADHFFNAELLSSQFDALEFPEDGEPITLVDASQSVDALVFSITRLLD